MADTQRGGRGEGMNCDRNNSNTGISVFLMALAWAGVGLACVEWGELRSLFPILVVTPILIRSNMARILM